MGGLLGSLGGWFWGWGKRCGFNDRLKHGLQLCGRRWREGVGDGGRGWGFGVDLRYEGILLDDVGRPCDGVGRGGACGDGFGCGDGRGEAEARG